MIVKNKLKQKQVKTYSIFYDIILLILHLN